MLFNRICLYLLAAGLPFILSFRIFFDPLIPKEALWTVAGGALLLFPGLPLGMPPLLRLFLALAAVMSAVSGALPGSLTPWLVGALVFLRAREEAARDGALLRLVRFTSAVAAAAALYAVSQAAWNSLGSSIKLVNPFGNRVLGTLGNPNFLADYLAAHLPLALTLAGLSASRMGWAVWSAAALAIAGAVLLSGSKGGQLAAVAALAGWVLVFRRAGFPAIRLWAGPAVAGVALVGVLAVSPASLVRAVERWTSSSERFSFTQRADILKGSASLVARSPLVGHGPGTYPVLFPSEAPPRLASSLGLTLSVNHAHNDFAEVASDLGLAGLALLLLLLFRPLSALSTPGIRSGPALGLVSLAVSMSTDFALFLPSTAFFIWLFAGLLSPAGVHRRVGTPARLAGAALAVLLGASALAGLATSALLARAREAIDSSDARRAESILERAVALSPSERHPWQFLGRALEMQSRLPEASAAYRQARDLAPWHPITSMNVARVERERWRLTEGRAPGSYEDALEALKTALRVNPYLSEARVWGGEMALAVRDFDAARGFLFDLPPDQAEPPSGIRRIRSKWYAARGMRAESRAEESLAGQAEARETVAAAEQALNRGDNPGALRLADRAATLDPALVPAWDLKGYLNHGSGNLREARNCYARVAVLDPANLNAHLNLTIIGLALRDIPLARAHSSKAMEIAPESPDAHLARARLLGFTGNKAGAEKEYEWIIARDPKHPLARTELAALRSR